MVVMGNAPVLDKSIIAQWNDGFASVLESFRMEQKILTLASNSPRRRQLLALGKREFGVAVSNIDESVLADENPRDYVLRLAEAKARAVAEQVDANQIVIGSDTTVALGDAILGKPEDEAEARSMLKRLRGKTHQVYTAVAVYRRVDNKIETELCSIDVPMRNYSDDEIESYIRTGDPMDKAGAYAIQHPEFNPVESMRGCYAGVMGLPLCHLTRALKKFNVGISADIALECQAYLKYACPVSDAILKGNE
jgi:MAF protein